MTDKVLIVDGVTGERTFRDITSDEAAQKEADEVSGREMFKAEIRARRSGLLRDSDWSQLSDAQLSDAKRAEWSAYRQELRDLPMQPGFPTEITWPTAPT